MNVNLNDGWELLTICPADTNFPRHHQPNIRGMRGHPGVLTCRYCHQTIWRQYRVDDPRPYPRPILYASLQPHIIAEEDTPTWPT